MRPDRFTSRLQEALGEAQSLAVARDNPDTIILRLTDGIIVQDMGNNSTPRVLSFTRHDLPIDLPAVERFRARGDEQREYILSELLRIGWGGEAETRTEQAGSQARETGRQP